MSKGSDTILVEAYGTDYQISQALITNEHNGYILISIEKDSIDFETFCTYKEKNEFKNNNNERKNCYPF
jgi:hypothetical protein